MQHSHTDDHARHRHNYEADVDFPVRRVLLKKTASHVYFGINGDELVVLSVWGARRRRGPKL